MALSKCTVNEAVEKVLDLEIIFFKSNKAYMKYVERDLRKMRFEDGTFATASQ